VLAAAIVSAALFAACGGGDSSGPTTTRGRNPHWSDKAPASARAAERRVGGFNSGERAAYKKGIRHILNAHQKVGAFTIAQVIDDAERREAARASAHAEAVRLAHERAALANGPRTVSAACAAFGAKLRGVSGVGEIVASYRCSGEDRSIFHVDATIRDEAWTAMTYDQRLSLAHSLWAGAVGAARLEQADSAHVRLVGEQGESLGGSSWLAGSMIDVNKD